MSSELMSDLIKLVLTSSDAHLSHRPVLCSLSLIPIRTEIEQSMMSECQ